MGIRTAKPKHWTRPDRGPAPSGNLADCRRWHKRPFGAGLPGSSLAGTAAPRGAGHSAAKEKGRSMAERPFHCRAHASSPAP